MRVGFDDARREGWTQAGRVAKPATAPAGYTPHTVVTEWLTLNCRGAWACQGRKHRIEILFREAADARRARLHFQALGLWG